MKVVFLIWFAVLSTLYAAKSKNTQGLVKTVFSIQRLSTLNLSWKEIIINAIAHRDYSIKGTDIQIKMFNDRITVESPGILPGIVRLNNLRTVHFSRNPNIARFLHEYDYVQEFGEGIDRMFNEMAAAGLPAPEYHDNAFMLNATIRNGVINETDGVINEVINGAINIFCSLSRLF